jgi:hypothetical protein
LCRERKEHSRDYHHNTTSQHTQTMKCLHKMHNFKGWFQWHRHNYKPKQEVPPQAAQLQGVIKDEKQDPIKEPPRARDAQLLVNYPQLLK